MKYFVDYCQLIKICLEIWLTHMSCNGRRSYKGPPPHGLTWIHTKLGVEIASSDAIYLLKMNLAEELGPVTARDVSTVFIVVPNFRKTAPPAAWANHGIYLTNNGNVLCTAVFPWKAVLYRRQFHTSHMIGPGSEQSSVRQYIKTAIARGITWYRHNRDLLISYCRAHHIYHLSLNSWGIIIFQLKG